MEILKVGPQTNEIAQLMVFAPKPGTAGFVTVKQGRSSLFLTADEATEFGAQLLNAASIAHGIAKAAA